MRAPRTCQLLTTEPMEHACPDPVRHLLHKAKDPPVRVPEVVDSGDKDVLRLLTSHHFSLINPLSCLGFDRIDMPVGRFDRHRTGS